MIKPILVASLALLSASASVFAEGTSAPAAGHGNHPCKKLVAACEAAGFVKGGHKDGGKGLWKDCMHSLKEGKAVTGVNVDPADVQACKAKKEAHSAH